MGMDVLDTYIYNGSQGAAGFLTVLLAVIQILVWIFKLYVAVRIVIACNIYIKKNKKTAGKESPDPPNE